MNSKTIMEQYYQDKLNHIEEISLRPLPVKNHPSKKHFLFQLTWDSALGYVLFIGVVIYNVLKDPIYNFIPILPGISLPF